LNFLSERGGTQKRKCNQTEVFAWTAATKGSKHSRGIVPRSLSCCVHDTFECIVMASGVSEIQKDLRGGYIGHSAFASSTAVAVAAVWR
jgi:hypothetical protein